MLGYTFPDSIKGRIKPPFDEKHTRNKEDYRMADKLSKTGSHSRFDSCQARHLLFAGLLSLFSHATFADSIHWQKNDYIRKSFIEIALNSEYTTEVSKVRKWTQPISYSIIHRTTDKTLHQRITESHLRHLASITGLDIQPSPTKAKTNLTIIFSTEKLIHQELKQDFLLNNQQQRIDLSRNSVCLVRFSTYSDSSIKQAVVIIPVDRARAHAKLLSCVVEELTQVMGLPNDSEKVFPSIFNDKSHNDYLSGLDFLLLKLLYHNDMKVGMNKDQVNNQLIKIISSASFQKLIIESEYLAHQQGLYRLLN